MKRGLTVARRPPSLKFLFHLSPRSDSLTFNLVSLQLDLNHSGLENFMHQTARINSTQRGFMLFYYFTCRTVR